MNPDMHDRSAAGVAATIGVPARARMLYSLLDGRAKTSTELAVAADVMPSTASIHLRRMLDQGLVTVFVQGKHRYYALQGPAVATALEALEVVAGAGCLSGVESSVPNPMRAARSCYDHIAGVLGVSIHDRLKSLHWIKDARYGRTAYSVTAAGERGLSLMGVDLAELRKQRRRFAFGCLDWSERRPHLAGARGAALFDAALQRRWVSRDDDSRALSISALGKRELSRRFGVSM